MEDGTSCSIVKSEPGGVIKTETSGDWRYELGPNTLLLKDPEIEELINELGISSRVETANSEASKTVYCKKWRAESASTIIDRFFEDPALFGKSKNAAA